MRRAVLQYIQTPSWPVRAICSTLYISYREGGEGNISPPLHGASIVGSFTAQLPVTPVTAVTAPQTKNP